MKTEGLFSKVTRERVSSNPGRRSGDGRLESAWGRKAGRNRDSGEASHGRRQRTRRRARIGGLGSAKRGTEGTRELGGRRGVVHGSRRRPEGKAGARAPWPAAWSSRRSRIGRYKPRNAKRNAWGERGDHGELTTGENRRRRRLGDGCPRGGGRRNPATSERRLLGPPVRERGEIGAGQQGRTRGGSAAF